jgi:hypothetical protein
MYQMVHAVVPGVDVVSGTVGNVVIVGDGETMVGFGNKQAWLAVRDGDAASLTSALALRDLGPVSWRDGIDLAYLTDDRLALTPLLPGADGSRWLLVTGRGLLRPDRTVHTGPLSATLGREVQYFVTHRVLELHRWERAIDGGVVRQFEYLGETGEVTTWHGDPDATELRIGLPAVPDDEKTVLVSERDVMHVARAWSVDPTQLDGQPATGPLHLAAW